MSSSWTPPRPFRANIRTRRAIARAFEWFGFLAFWLRIFSAPGALVYFLEALDYWPFEGEEWAWLTKLSLAVFLFVHVGPYVAFAISQALLFGASLFYGVGKALEHPQRHRWPGWPRRLAFVHLVMLFCVLAVCTYVLVANGTVQSIVLNGWQRWSEFAIRVAQGDRGPVPHMPSSSPAPDEQRPAKELRDDESKRPFPPGVPRDWQVPSTRFTDYLPPNMTAPKQPKIATRSKPRAPKLAPFPDSDTGLGYASPLLVPCVFIALVQPNAMPRECKGDWPSRSTPIGW
jgi:hypothetical protein